ncbi:MAG: RNA-binding S4 domain-containing protein [Gammaproteobacteria bacterium]
MSEDLRIDKWLWAARFFKTRGLAREAIEGGRVLVGGDRVKPSRQVRIGDEIRVRGPEFERTVRVAGLSGQRGPAPVAQALYEETEASVRARVEAQARRAVAADPAAALEHGRPTKRDRRRIERLRDAHQGREGTR